MNSDCANSSESMSTKSDEIYTSIIINFNDFTSFDDAFNKYAMPCRKVCRLSAKHCDILLKQIVEDCKSCGDDNVNDNVNDNVDDVVTDTVFSIRKVGYTNVTVNFDCCSGYGTPRCSESDVDGTSMPRCSNVHQFCDLSTSMNVIHVIKHFLSNGSQIICSDFALKSLISQWDANVLGVKCPFVNTGIINGNMMVVFGINECKECCFPQLSAVADLAIPDLPDLPNSSNAANENETSNNDCVSHMTMDASIWTIRYKIADDLDPALTVKVMSVATGYVTREIIHNKPNKKIKTDNTCTAREDSQGSSSLPPFLPFKLYQASGKLSNTIADSDNKPKKATQLDKLCMPPPLARQMSMGIDMSATCDRKNVSEIKKFRYREIVSPFDKTGSFTEVYGIKRLKGIPIHTIVEFRDMPGTLVVSSLHLVNLVDVNTNTRNINQVATQVLSRERSDEIASLLSQSQIDTMPVSLLRSMTSEIIAEIATCNLKRSSTV
jgi:hypothetical protein